MFDTLKFAAAVAPLAAAAAVAAAAWPPDWLPAAGGYEGNLCRRPFLTEEQGARALQEALAAFPDAAGWSAHAGRARMRILQGMGMDPLPERSPLRVVAHSLRFHDGYSVENIAIETAPGSWLTGNLYRPSGHAPPHAAVLHPHGHSPGVDGAEGWGGHGRFKADVQHRAAALARMGAVSLTLDMAGYGDQTAIPGAEPHGSPSAMAEQFWNGVRAIDFLQGLPEVDPERIGVTGHSGGATQAFLLGALDQRVAVQASVCMVSAHFFGGCACESGQPVHLGPDHFVSPPMIAAMMAPRPLLLVSVGGDWTLNTPRVEYPFVREVYRRAGAQDRAANVHLPEEGHNYGFSKRAALYAFMARWLDLDPAPMLGADGEWNEDAITIEDPATLRVFGERFPVPDGAGPRDMRVVDLRCEGIVEPVGIDAHRPRLSWRLESQRRGARQTAWAVRAASSPALLEAGEPDLWDSGKTAGADTGHVYRATPLAYHERVHWQVRIWDEHDQPSGWSAPAQWTMGMPDRRGWGAEWITHPEWLAFERTHLGYLSEPADFVETPKWIELDLGRDYPVDTVVLHALRHTVAERLGFPVSFTVEVSASGAPLQRHVIFDTTGDPLNIWFTRHEVDAGGIVGRFVRLGVPVLRELNGEIRLALSQIEVLSGGRNVAEGAVVSASDSVESGSWSAAALVDGMGLPGANPVARNTVEMRREFTLEAQPVRAMLHIAGLGGYIVEVNGRRLGDDVLKPGWTNVDKTVPYASHDITGLLHAGGNAIGMRLAPGMYSVADPDDRYTKFVGRFRPLMARATVWLQFPDGRVEQFGTDKRWRTRKSAVVPYAHIFGGEDYDARAAEPGWSMAGLHEGGAWVAAVPTKGPEGWLRGVNGSAPPITHHETLRPVAVASIRPGIALHDLGQNASVMVRLEVRGKAGDRVRVIPAELVGADGAVDRGSVAHRSRPAYWEYTLAGAPEGERWKADFFYHGARYLQVETTPVDGSGTHPEVLRIEGLVTHTSAAPAGTFRTSSDLYNRTRELVRWAQRSNLVSVMTDCPHRERLGWLEQYHLNGPSLRYHFDLARLYAKAFSDMIDAQTPAGLVPNIAPEYIVFEGAFRDSPEWGSAIVLAGWQQYLFTGDASILPRLYNEMQQYVAYLDRRSRDGILDHGLGDWYDLGPEHPGFAQLTPRALTATAIFYECITTLHRIASLRGRQGEAAAYSEWAERVRDAFNDRFLDRATGVYATGSQTAQAMPLVVGLVPDDLRSLVLERLIEDIRGRGDALTSGDVGHRYLLRALAEAGRSDVIHDMHHQSDRPGYGWQLERGATSLVEAWDANRRASQNHFMLGHIIEWFHHHMVGIAPDPEAPGFRHFRIAPQPVGDLRFAEASHRAPPGLIRVRWDRQDDRFRLRATVPPNAGATVHLQADPGAPVLEGGRPAGEQPGVVFIGWEDRRALYRISSGSYDFEFTWRE